MEDKDKRNQELFIVGQAFLHTGIREVEDILERYITTATYYNDSYTVSLLKKAQQDISKIKDTMDKDREEALKQKEPHIFVYSGKIIKVYDTTTKCEFCVKKDYINDELVEIQGICLEFEKSQITEIDQEQCQMVEEVYCESDNKLYQLAIKEFNNRDYGKVLYENIKNSFLVLKKEEVLER
ncbi:hypothetical protein [uncultured Clostridium sp.]|jgi:hypothetical protein|uniref:hypothetical protein n=1 Tax=uncultured Clostridium sp. TaxID=59620 RepID=UPI00272D8BD3|nr:hypothetical protein [uncultured Clostridium sp.]